MKKGIDYLGVGCGVHIYNDKDQILLLKRTEQSRNNARFWSVPGGAVEFNELVEGAVKREAMEELGVEIEVLRLLNLYDDIIEEESQHWIAPQYLCKITKGEIKNLEPHKTSEIKWFDLDKLPEKLKLSSKSGIEAYKKTL